MHTTVLRRLVFVVLLGLVAQTAQAAPAFTMYNGRMAGLGNNGALARQITSTLVNPLWVSDSWFSFGIAGGVNAVEVNDSITYIEEVAQASIFDTTSPLYTDDQVYQRFLGDLQRLESDFEGVGVQAAGGVAFAVKNFRFTYNRYAGLDLAVSVDSTNISQDTSSPNSLQNNQSTVTLAGAEISQYALGYTHEFMGGMTGMGETTIQVGGHFVLYDQDSYVLAKSAYDEDLEDANFDELYDELFEESKTGSSAVDLDLAVGAQFGELLKVALVGQHLLSPDIDYFQGFVEYSIDPQVRILSSVKATPWLDIGLDAELLVAESFTSSLKSQEIRLGSEFGVPYVPVRLGMIYDIEQGVFSMSTGLGVEVWKIFFNVGAVYSFTDFRIDAGFDIGFFI